LHTALATVTPKINSNIVTKHETIEGGIGLEWVQIDDKQNLSQNKNKDVLIFIMPGLTGSAKDRYTYRILIYGYI